ncbi:MAG TPA: glycoside hydrolase family 9 protein [Polyangia bacterium]
MRFFPILGVTLVAFLPRPAPAGDSDVRVASIGYLPARAKVATITNESTSFHLFREADGSVAFDGMTAGPLIDPDTAAGVWLADFSSIAESGLFYLQVDGVGRSVSFPIGDDVYREPLRAAMIGLYGQRCNTPVSIAYGGQNWNHAACHMNDGLLDYIGGGGKRDGHKGWHDAGDYGKYTVNAGISVGSMLAAWEEYGDALAGLSLPIPESGGAAPDYLDEIRWELDWLLTMQYSASDGRVSHKLTSLGFDAFEMPEADHRSRYFVPWGSAATADFVAMLAKAARIYRPYDASFADQCLAAAQTSYAFLTDNPASHPPDQTGFSTGGYTTGDGDDRLWAAAEMWETTGDAAALADFETRAAGQKPMVDSDFDWSNVKNLGMLVYLQSKRDGRSAELVAAIQTDLLSAAATLVSARNGSGYGRALARYYWGSNGSVARTCMVLQAANRVAPDPTYLDTCVDQLGWLFGRNQYNRSQVTGVGLNPPLHPHHRPSGADGVVPPWPGLLVGGGETATNWVDVQDNYRVNEIAINWNAALVYALAGFLTTKAEAPIEGGPAPPAPAPQGCSCRLSAPTAQPSGLPWSLLLAALVHLRRRR